MDTNLPRTKILRKPKGRTAPKVPEDTPTRGKQTLREPATTLWQKKKEPLHREPPTILRKDHFESIEQEQPRKKSKDLRKPVTPSWRKLLTKELLTGGLIGACTAVVLCTTAFKSSTSSPTQVRATEDESQTASSAAGQTFAKPSRKPGAGKKGRLNHVLRKGNKTSLKGEHRASKTSHITYHLELRAFYALKQGNLREAMQSYRSLAKQSKEHASFGEIVTLLSRVQQGACVSLPSGDTCEGEKK